MRARRPALISVLVVLLLGVSGALSAQPPDTGNGQPPVTFRLDIDYVEVDAVVTDANGDFVRDLSIDDFRIVEDGEPQQVEIFSLVDLPLPRPASRSVPDTPIEPDVHSNAPSFGGRLYVLILDDYHTVPLRTARVVAAARLFVEQHLGPDDYAAVIHTSGRRRPVRALRATSAYSWRRSPSSSGAKHRPAR